MTTEGKRTRIKILIALVRKVLLLIMSQTLPGVPETTWTPYSSFLISSPILFPPMHAWACTFMYSPIANITFSVWAASSLVGDRISACTLKKICMNLNRWVLIMVNHVDAEFVCKSHRYDMYLFLVTIWYENFNQKYCIKPQWLEKIYISISNSWDIIKHINVMNIPIHHKRKDFPGSLFQGCNY